MIFPPFFFPIRFTRNDEIWLVDDDQTLVRFNDKGELLEHRVHGGMGSLVYRYWDFVTYRESLLPLPMQAIEDAEYMERDLIS